MRACTSPLDGRRALLRLPAASPLVAGLDLPRNRLAARAQEPDITAVNKITKASLADRRG